jgi:predicted DNA binding CopG/RHH family protein
LFDDPSSSARSVPAPPTEPRTGSFTKKKTSTEGRKKKLAPAGHERIDTSDIPDLGKTSGWVRGLMYRPVLQPISIRLPAPDIAAAQKLARKKGIPYQTYIKTLLHEALARELGGRG